MTVPAVAAILFVLGAYGVVTRRNIINVLLCIELMMNAANLNLVYFARTSGPAAGAGNVFAVLLIAVAAAETAVGLALALAVYRRIKSVLTDDIAVLKG